MHCKLDTLEALSHTMSFAPEGCHEPIAMALMSNLVFQAWETLHGRDRMPPSLLPLLCDKEFLQRVLDTIEPWADPLQSVRFPGRSIPARPHANNDANNTHCHSLPPLLLLLQLLGALF